MSAPKSEAAGADLVTPVPGRELDALIAEKVMGAIGVGYYAPTKGHGAHLDYVKVATWAEAKAAYDKFWPADTVRDHVREDVHAWQENWGPVYVPEYSTDIAAAWEVVAHFAGLEKVIGHNGGVDLTDRWQVQIQYDYAWMWDATFTHIVDRNSVGSDVEEFMAQAETAPLAICRAALLAVGTPVPGPRTP